MMERVPAPLLVVPLDQREVGHPQRAPLARAHEAEARRELQPQRAERLRRDAGVVGHQQQQVAGRGLERRGHRRAARRRTRNFATGERQPPPSSTYAHTRPPAPWPCANSISLSSSARDSSCAPALMPRTTPPPSSTPRKTLNSVSPQRVAEVADLEPEAHVGPVGAEARDRVVVGQARERRLELHPAGRERRRRARPR